MLATANILAYETPQAIPTVSKKKVIWDNLKSYCLTSQIAANAAHILHKQHL